MITKGTTPIHKFTFPFEKNDMEKITITYKQGKELLKKQINEIGYEPGQLIVNLTQEETLKFKSSSNASVEIQIKCKNKNGKIFASNIIATSVGRILDEEVM